MKNLARIFAVLVFTLSFCIAVNAETSSTAQTPAGISNTQETKKDSNQKAPQTALFKTDTIEFDTKPVEFSTISYKDRVYLKLRDICYALKCNVEVDNNTKIINIIKNPQSVQENVYADKEKTLKEIKVNIDVSNFNIKTDGINTYMESIIYQGRTYVPVRFFSEVFEKKIDWIADKKKVKVSTVPPVIIGSVNGQALYKSDFDFIYNPQYINLTNNTTGEPSESDVKAIKDSSFENLTEFAILLQNAKKEKITLTDSDYQEINDALSIYINNNGGIDNFRATLEKFQITLYQFSNNLKDTVLIKKMALNSVKDVAANEESIKKFYEANPDMFTIPEQVRAKHILFSTIDMTTSAAFDDQKKAEIKKKAEGVLAEIKAGANFDTLMNKYNEDPGVSQSPNGYTFAKGQMIKEFEDKAFSMKVGEVSDLVETSFGYHIIKLEEKIPQKKMTLDESKDSIKAELDQQEKQSHWDKQIEKLKAESKIENTLK